MVNAAGGKGTSPKFSPGGDIGHDVTQFLHSR
jgi:hypothetical protein